MRLLKFIPILILFLLYVSCTENHTKSKESVAIIEKQSVPIIEKMNVSTFAEAIKADNIQLVDVRTTNEWENGHLKNARHIELNNPKWDSQIQELDTNEPVYVYCAKGGRSAKSAKLLKDAGFTKIYDLEGGITSWMSAGQFIEK